VVWSARAQRARPATPADRLPRVIAAGPPRSRALDSASMVDESCIVVSVVTVSHGGATGGRAVRAVGERARGPAPGCSDRCLLERGRRRLRRDDDAGNSGCAPGARLSGNAGPRRVGGEVADRERRCRGRRSRAGSLLWHRQRFHGAENSRPVRPAGGLFRHSAREEGRFFRLPGTWRRAEGCRRVEGTPDLPHPSRGSPACSYAARSPAAEAVRWPASVRRSSTATPGSSFSSTGR